MPPSPRPDRNRLLRRAGWWPTLALALVFSAALNLLHLALPLFSMQVFNRVLPSASLATLLALSGLAILLIVATVFLEGARTALLTRFATRLDALLFRPAAAHEVNGDEAGILQDVETLRAFGSSSLAPAMLDVPWSLVFLAAIFLIHPLLGWIATLSLLFCGGGVLLRWFATSILDREMARSAHQVTSHLEGARASRQAVDAMGLAPRLVDRLTRHRFRFAHSALILSERTAWMEALGRGLRSALLVMALAAAAWLVLSDAVEPGAIIAVSLLFGRTSLALERVSQSSQSFRAAARAWRRAAGHACIHSPASPKLELPALRGLVALEAASVFVPDKEAPICGPLDLSLAPGQVAVVVGPEGAGKSTLARLVAGAIPPTRGVMRLDGADAASLDPRARGPRVGFLPENVELGIGPVATIIARGDLPDGAAVVAAARLAGVHEFILRLPEGYQTVLGINNHLSLSAGARRRIGLARALYRLPALVVLDEPTAQLDDCGETDLVRIVHELQNRGSTVLVVSRQAALWKVADRLLLMEGGRITFHCGRSDIQSFARLRLATHKGSESAEARGAKQRA